MPREGALLPHTSESRLSALPVAVLCALVVALLAAAAGGAQAASVVGPGGEVTGCYVKKAKKKKGTRFIVPKGTLRVVPPGKRCKKGERQIAWNAVGQPGQTGSQGGSGQVSVTTLQDRVTQLQDRVTQLESILSGVTNGGLLGRDRLGQFALRRGPHGRRPGERHPLRAQRAVAQRRYPRSGFC